ncbi:hypothetical protein [Xanthomonas oryzae]|uniref:hypothetical protein n=3 Tax=Xanthomonas oryzae TaxID=347 RepID=UPI00338E25B3
MVRVVGCGDGFEVTWSDAFPAEFRVFQLWPAPEVWPGYKEVEGSLGVIEEDGKTLWRCGTGVSVKAAAEDALVKFVNWPVHPADVTANDLCRRSVLDDAEERNFCGGD